MTLWVITYDVRAKYHDYKSLYEQLNHWKAAHLQDSVWLADLNGTAADIRDTLKRHMHPDDTACVIQVFTNSGWATSYARPEGNEWLKSRIG